MPTRRRIAGLVLALAPGVAAAQETAVPVVRVTGPTVIAFWRVPESDSVLVADPDLASALDDHQYYWAETRPRLSAAGITPVDQPGRRFTVQEPDRTWVFAAAPDSAPIGYLLVEPGRPPRVLYRIWLPDDLLEAARGLFAR